MASGPTIGSQRIQDLAPSATIAMANRVRELRAEGKDIISLTLGEPDFDTPIHIKNAGVEAIRANFTHYPPVAGIPELRQAACDFLCGYYGQSWQPEHIVVSTGAKQSLFNLFQVLCGAGDEVILPAPFWVSYRSIIELAGGVPHIVQTTTEQHYKITPEQLEAAITSKTRAFLLNSPGNPSGSVYTRDELEALAAVLRQNPHVWVVSDEIYSLLTYDDEHISFSTLEGMSERTICITGVSKAFSMTGWRIGIMAAPLEVAKLCEKYQGQVTSGANAMAQKAAVVAFSNNLSTVYRMRTNLRRRRDNGLAAFAASIPDWKLPVPQGAFYFYPDVSAHFGRKTPTGNTIADAKDLTLYLIDEAGVAAVPGDAFGTDRHLRFSYAISSRVFSDAVTRMAEALARLT